MSNAVMSNLVHMELHNICRINYLMRHYWVKGMCIFTFDRRCQFAVHTGCALNMPTIMRDCLFSSLWPTPQQIFSVPHEFLCSPSPLCVLRLRMDSLLQTFSSITLSPLCHILCRCRVTVTGRSLCLAKFCSSSKYSLRCHVFCEASLSSLGSVSQ